MSNAVHFDLHQLRAVILFEYLQKHPVVDAIKNIHNTLGEKAISESAIRHWFHEFEKGDLCLADHDHHRINEAKLEEMIRDDPSRSVRDLATQVRHREDTIARHLEGLGWKYGPEGKWEHI